VGSRFGVRGTIARQDPDVRESVTDLDCPPSSWSAKPEPGRPRPQSRGWVPGLRSWRSPVAPRSKSRSRQWRGIAIDVHGVTLLPSAQLLRV